MSLEVGQILDGKVTGITKFGAFVEMSDGNVGMVHISEVSNTYVEDISKHLELKQEVKVKVISINDDGKIALSIKKAMPKQTQSDNKPKQQKEFKDNTKPVKQNFNKNNSNNNNTSKEPKNFEDMLSKFMSASADKFSDMPKPNERRRGAKKKTSRDYGY